MTRLLRALLVECPSVSLIRGVCDTLCILACSVPHAGVRVLEWDGSSWSARGADILTTGLSSVEQFGSAVSLSCDGSIVAVGAPGTNPNNGLVAAFQYSSGVWAAYGQSSGFTYSFGSETDTYAFGQAVTISADARQIAVGAPTATSSKGLVELNELQSGNYVSYWETVGSNNGNRGTAVALSADSEWLVFGDPGSNAGRGQMRLVLSSCNIPLPSS